MAQAAAAQLVAQRELAKILVSVPLFDGTGSVREFVGKAEAAIAVAGCADDNACCARSISARVARKS